MVRDKRIRTVFCSLALIGLLCGCRAQTDGLVFVGETDGRSGNGAGAAGNGAEAGQESENGAESTVDSSALPSEEAPRIYVYVCGAVNCPGVVELPEGSRAEAALKAAGGFREDAGTDYVNLAARVGDGEKLYFPTVEEKTEFSEESGENALININTADEETLCTLPGIGISKARDILRYREENGPFESCEDIMNVPGIKTNVYGKIKDGIRVD